MAVGRAVVAGIRSQRVVKLLSDLTPEVANALSLCTELALALGRQKRLLATEDVTRGLALVIRGDLTVLSTVVGLHPLVVLQEGVPSFGMVKRKIRDGRTTGGSCSSRRWVGNAERLIGNRLADQLAFVKES